MNKTRFQFLVASCLAVVAVVIGATASSAGTSAQQSVKIRVGAMPYQDYLSIQVGQEKGWFKQEGLDVEIIILPWYDQVNTALASGAIDIGSSTPDSRLAVHHKFPGAKLGLLGFSFEGFGLIVRPGQFKTFEQLYKANGRNKTKALRDAMRQLKGKTLLYPKQGGSTTFVETALGTAGLKLSDVKSIDMNSDLALAAFLRGQGDAFLGGLPQRTKALKEGHKLLVTASNLPPAAAELVGWAVTDKFAKANPDAFLKFMHVWYKGFQYYKKNPNDAGKIIVKKVNSISNSGLTVPALKALWNVGTAAQLSVPNAQTAEYFPINAKAAQGFFFSPKGTRYWRTSYNAVMKSYIRQGLYKSPVPAAQIVSAPTWQKRYLAKYGSK